jgi:hypothetical protein
MTGEGPTGCTCGEWEGGRRAEHLHADWGGADDQLHLWGVGRRGAVLSTCMLIGEGPTISYTLSSVPSGQYFLMTHNWFCCGNMYPNTKAAGISGVARLGMGFMITWSVSRMST